MNGSDTIRDAFDRAERIDAPLRPKAAAILDRIENAMHVAPELNVPYVVKGWLHAGTLSVLYGPPGTGKTFLALDIANHVQNGEAWGGCRVTKSNVLYVAAEAGANFANRIAALDRPTLWMLPGPIRLGGPDDDSGPIAEALGRLSDAKGPFGLIVVDTLARVMEGADENSGADIARLVAALSKLAKATGAHVMVIHHTGKDAERGMRGHSALLGAIDTEIRVSKDREDPAKKRIVAEATKQRDMAPASPFVYRLAPVVLGTDADGDPVTSCVVMREP